MDKKLKTNVLMIGKSGAGKSSLLHYVFGLESEATGVGQPLTAEGLNHHAFDCGEAFTINLYNTWGLEVNQAERWQQLILDEVRQHHCAHIAEWFHTIIYVFSAKTGRIDGFEKSIIRELIDQGNRVMPVLTHCDLPSVDNAIHQMEGILQELGIDHQSIVRACPVARKLLGGLETVPFGIEDIFYNIRKNHQLWCQIHA